jgi:YD repeat-containing protein
MLKHIAVFFFLLVACVSVNAQIPRDVKPLTSPSVASLGQFGDIPVSLFSGLPSISIPLYNIQDGKLNIPISMSYHASGFRPDVHPGWVGMGWALSAGGVVTRSVRDRIDEFADPAKPNDPNSGGYYFQYGLLANSTWEQASYIHDRIIVGKGGIQGGTDPTYILDTEPDEFSFNFLGYQGNFYLNHKGEWQVKCDKSIKVKLLSIPANSTSSGGILLSPPFAATVNNGIPYRKSFAGFVIIGEDGTQYEFGGSTEAIEYSTDFFGQGSGIFPMTATSWQLTKITAPDGKIARLTYQRESGRGKFINTMYYSVYGELYTRVSDPNNSWLTQTNCSGSFTMSYLANDVIAYQAGQLISPVYLRSIETPNFKADFISSISRELRYDNDKAYGYRYYNYSNNNPNRNAYFLPLLESGSYVYPQCLEQLQWKKLDKISIENNGSPLKNILFTYSDRVGNEIQADKQRLTLEAITEVGNNQFAATYYLVKPSYRFIYNSQGTPQGHDTGYLSNKVDHWGFYSGFLGSYDDGDFDYYYRKREATNVLSYATMGMLTKITYPTGGSTEFVYEQPWYGQYVPENRSLAPLPAQNNRERAGGVRIRKIISYPLTKDTPPVEKEYFYVRNYQNGADINNLPQSGILSGKSRYYFDDYSIPIINHPEGRFAKGIFANQPVIPASANKGAYIGYSEVIEKRSDGSYTKFTYSNFDTGPTYRDEVVATSNTLMPQRTIYQPFISAEQMRGNLLKEELYTVTNRLVKKREIEYSPINKYEEYVRAIQAVATLACSTSNTDAFEEGTSYRVSTYSVLPTNERETIIDLTDLSGNTQLTTAKSTQYSSVLGRRLVTSQSVTDSKGQTLTTTYRYPVDFDYNYGAIGNSPGETVASAMYAMRERNMLDTPIETVTKRSQDGLAISAAVQTYTWGDANKSVIVPYAYYNLETAQPIQYTPSAYTNSAAGDFIVAGGASNMRLKATWQRYNEVYNPVDILKDGNVRNSYLYGYANSLPVAKIDNAASSEVFYSSFEEDASIGSQAPDIARRWYSPGNYLRFENNPSQGSSYRNVAHTGRLAGAMYTNGQGEQAHAFSTTLTVNNSAARRYLLSGWVYTNGPAASLWVFPNLPSARNADGTIRYYDGLSNASRPDLVPSYISTENNAVASQTGRWIYLEKEVLIPADATLLTVRLTNFWSGASNAAASANGGGAWFEDIRLLPLNAQMTTYTHQPGIGVTSISDTGNRPVLFEYDALGRLLTRRDQNGNVTTSYEYRYHQ